MADLPDSWNSVLSDLGLEAKPAEAPTDTAGDWFELYASFQTRGFVRALAAQNGDKTHLRLQLAVPTGEHADGEVRDRILRAFAEAVGGDWNVVSEDPEWLLTGHLNGSLDEAQLGRWLRRVEDLADLSETGEIDEIDWLAEPKDSSDEQEDEEVSADPVEETPADSAPKSSESDVSGGLFESIGDDTPSSGLGRDDSQVSGLIEEARLADFDVWTTDETVCARFRVDVDLPEADREELGRALAHALRARYDLAARPLPPQTKADEGATAIRLEVTPSEGGISGALSLDEIGEDVESYFERLARFDEHGVRLANFLGIDGDDSGSSGSTAGSRSRKASATRRKRGSGRTGSRSAPTDSSESGRERTARRSESRRSRSTPRQRDEPAADADGSVVLDLGGGSDDASPDSAAPEGEGELKAGNYRDPRLLREDAETSLVDVVLRHPGYAERKMGHNLSILLSIDFPDAIELVEAAPSVLAWGVSRQRGLRFKRVIEDAGGKVVLVEPDSLT